ncbi:hypothetical protein JB92DRAFT_2854061 [Gautieria morchelliformis]|nr:hypothetical protein JB92DRAFT_2854061 [Gautieria morchelliformis]
MSFPAYCSPFLLRSVGDQLVYLQCLSFISLGLGVLNHRLFAHPAIRLASFPIVCAICSLMNSSSPAPCL